jgi:hypothetical protein
MIINELLFEKYKTQKRLDDIANHSLVKYVEDSHSRVKELSAKLGLKLKYGTPAPQNQSNKSHQPQDQLRHWAGR